MWGLLSGILWLTSFIMFPTLANGFWFPKDMAWLMGSFLLASSPWWNPPSRPSLRIPALGWLFMWIILSFGYFVLWPQINTPKVELQQYFVRRWHVSPIFPTMTWMGSLLALDALVRHTDTLQRWHRIALQLVRIGSVVSIWAVAQWIRLDPWRQFFQLPYNDPLSQSPITVLGNATVTGNFLAIIAPLCLMFSARRYRWGAFSLMLIAIGMTQSVMSFGTVMVASLLVWGLQRRWKVFLAACLCLVLGILLVWFLMPETWIAAYLNPHGRWAIWQTAMTFWVRNSWNAWIGYGAGSVGSLTTNGVWTYGFLHNDFLQWLFEFGIVGVILAGLAALQAAMNFRTMLWTGASTAWCGAAMAYGLLMLTGFPMQIGSLLMVGVVIAAAVLSHCQPPGGRHAQA